MTHGTLGKFEEAIATFDDLLARFGDSAEPALQEQVARALYNKACTFALADDVTATVATLRQWCGHVGSFDCEKVAKDKDFNAIRNDARFVALLAEMGCVKKQRRSGSKRKPRDAAH